MILVLFYVWEDARILAHWNYSLSSLSRASFQSAECFLFFSILNFPQGAPSRGGCSGWWLDPCRTGMVGNILCSVEWQATFPVHSCLCFSCHIQEIPKLMSRKFHLFSSTSFIVLLLTFSSFIYFELILVYGIFLLCLCNWPNSICWRDCFAIEKYRHPLENHLVIYKMVFFGPSSLLHWSTCLSSCQY